MAKDRVSSRSKQLPRIPEGSTRIAFNPPAQSSRTRSASHGFPLPPPLSSAARPSQSGDAALGGASRPSANASRSNFTTPVQSQRPRALSDTNGASAARKQDGLSIVTDHEHYYDFLSFTPSPSPAQETFARSTPLSPPSALSSPPTALFSPAMHSPGSVYSLPSPATPHSAAPSPAVVPAPAKALPLPSRNPPPTSLKLSKAAAPEFEIEEVLPTAPLFTNPWGSPTFVHTLPPEDSAPLSSRIPDTPGRLSPLPPTPGRLLPTPGRSPLTSGRLPLTPGRPPPVSAGLPPTPGRSSPIPPMPPIRPPRVNALSGTGTKSPAPSKAVPSSSSGQKLVPPTSRIRDDDSALSPFTQESFGRPLTNYLSTMAALSGDVPPPLYTPTADMDPGWHSPPVATPIVAIEAPKIEVVVPEPLDWDDSGSLFKSFARRSQQLAPLASGSFGERFNGGTIEPLAPTQPDSPMILGESSSRSESPSELPYMRNTPSPIPPPILLEEVAKVDPPVIVQRTTGAARQRRPSIKRGLTVTPGSPPATKEIGRTPRTPTIRGSRSSIIRARTASARRSAELALAAAAPSVGGSPLPPPPRPVHARALPALPIPMVLPSPTPSLLSARSDTTSRGSSSPTSLPPRSSTPLPKPPVSAPRELEPPLAPLPRNTHQRAKRSVSHSAGPVSRSSSSSLSSGPQPPSGYNTSSNTSPRSGSPVVVYQAVVEPLTLLQTKPRVVVPELAPTRSIWDQDSPVEFEPTALRKALKNAVKRSRGMVRASMEPPRPLPKSSPQKTRNATVLRKDSRTSAKSLTPPPASPPRPVISSPVVAISAPEPPPIPARLTMDLSDWLDSYMASAPSMDVPADVGLLGRSVSRKPSSVSDARMGSIDENPSLPPRKRSAPELFSRLETLAEGRAPSRQASASDLRAGSRF